MGDHPEEYLGWLGLVVKDMITGFAGTVTSVSFDLYGRVSALVYPGLKKDGEGIAEPEWIDVRRLGALGPSRVMPVPSYAGVPSPPA